MTKYLRANSKQIILDSIKEVEKRSLYWQMLILHLNENQKITFSFSNQEKLEFWKNFIEEYRTQ